MGALLRLRGSVIFLLTGLGCFSRSFFMCLPFSQANWRAPFPSCLYRPSPIWRARTPQRSPLGVSGEAPGKAEGDVGSVGLGESPCSSQGLRCCHEKASEPADP